MSKNIRELIAGTTVLSVDLGGLPEDLEISHLAYDSRLVKPGGLFVAIRGFKQDGHRYIKDAIAKGARTIVVDRPEIQLPSGVARVLVPNSRAALPDLAASFYDYPSRRMKVVGVTGTNGKTTTAFLCENIFRTAGFKTGLIGTVENHIGSQVLPVERTTPESVDVESLLWQMAEKGITHAAMEVSSHALELGRVKNIDFDVGIFTNLTQDHLDFHGTLDKYRQAKAQLFAQLNEGKNNAEPRTAVLNADDPNSEAMQAATSARILTYGIKNEADITAADIEIGAQEACFTLKTAKGQRKVTLHTTGLFSIYNALAACGMGVSLGIELDVIASALENMPGVPGRFEQVKCGQDFAAIVDYAHTPDGLENILTTAQEFATGRIILVFGCGGDRDRTKRPIMGRLGLEYADIVYITSDNPRTEDPVAIINEIEAGAKQAAKAKGSYYLIPDRRQAICAALAEAKAGDVVLVAGKGHETYQILGQKTVHFDDREVIRDYFKELNLPCSQ
ncbi:MAG TPA: UDP-N-acetylmuramoyl-L-alanyl-D-glutamate--2,6-diaminopimelate ligase [Firmicutes bacterium]|nr:UDP-N-acetylmuramoyl-L-alanyl-D-glutamate--2,6-diaminopimelate ligase [Bacillota bacterium]